MNGKVPLTQEDRACRRSCPVRIEGTYGWGRAHAPTASWCRRTAGAWSRRPVPSYCGRRCGRPSWPARPVSRAEKSVDLAREDLKVDPVNRPGSRSELADQLLRRDRGHGHGPVHARTVLGRPNRARELLPNGRSCSAVVKASEMASLRSWRFVACFSSGALSAPGAAHPGMGPVPAREPWARLPASGAAVAGAPSHAVARTLARGADIQVRDSSPGSPNQPPRLAGTRSRVSATSLVADRALTDPA